MPTFRKWQVTSDPIKREQLRAKGQFWTPNWVAEIMVDYVVAGKDCTIFDPAVGAGAFFRAAKHVSMIQEVSIRLEGVELDNSAIQQALGNGLEACDVEHVTIGDFVLSPPTQQYEAIVANPPYIRHHRISRKTKEALKGAVATIIGEPLDGRAGLHIYFLIRALTLLAKDGRLAFIMSADSCEGKFATRLWSWITKNYALDAVVTFDANATPFPSIDTNPIIFFIRNSQPTGSLAWARCLEAPNDALSQWVQSGFTTTPNHKQLIVAQRELDEALKTGLSRPPTTVSPSIYTLGDFARVMRGVATGSNEFFLLTKPQITELGIPLEYFIRAVGRTRDVPDHEVTPHLLRELEKRGRPTYLLALDGDALSSYPASLQNYLLEGIKRGLPQKPLISQRRPWYKTESRPVPPFLFTYLGRRDSRFIKNTAEVIPLTGFLCVYPHYTDQEFLQMVWNILRDPGVIANLSLVGKSYGNGSIKVEPRALERLPIPDSVVATLDGRPLQRRLFDAPTSYSHSAIHT